VDKYAYLGRASLYAGLLLAQTVDVGLIGRDTFHAFFGEKVE